MEQLRCRCLRFFQVLHEQEYISFSGTTSLQPVHSWASPLSLILVFDPDCKACRPFEFNLQDVACHLYMWWLNFSYTHIVQTRSSKINATYYRLGAVLTSSQIRHAQLCLITYPFHTLYKPPTYSLPSSTHTRTAHITQPTHKPVDAYQNMQATQLCENVITA